MKYLKIKDILVLIPILLISFFAGMNIADGFDFSITDTTVNDAVTAHYDEAEKVENVENKVSTKLKIVQTASSNTSSAKTVSAGSSSSNNSSASGNHINISGNSVALRYINCDSQMPTPNYSSAYFCNFRGSGNMFIYGHNTANIFGKLKNLSVGSTFTITLNGNTSTYKITSKFTNTVANLNSNSSLRSQIYSGTYGGNSAVTIQTCHGAGDSQRLYVKAIRI